MTRMIIGKEGEQKYIAPPKADPEILISKWVNEMQPLIKRLKTGRKNHPARRQP